MDSDEEAAQATADFLRNNRSAMAFGAPADFSAPARRGVPVLRAAPPTDDGMAASMRETAELASGAANTPRRRVVAVGRRFATRAARATTTPAPPATDFAALQRAALEAVGRSEPELSAGWLAEFCRSVDAGEGLGYDFGQRVYERESSVGATLRVTQRNDGWGSCRLFDGVTEAYFDTTTLIEADARAVVAGNVIHVTRVLIRASGDAPADLRDKHDRKSRVALLCLSLVSGALDEPRPDDDKDAPKALPAAPPTLMPGNVDALYGDGKQVLVRVLDVRREPGTEDRRRVVVSDGVATASCLTACGVTDACGVAPQSLCLVESLGSAAHDGATTIVLKTLTVVSAPPAAASLHYPSSSDESDDGAPAATPVKRRPTMVQSNLLSPDHGKPTFFVSPTGVEDFPITALRREGQGRDWRAEVAEDAGVFASSSTDAGDWRAKGPSVRDAAFTKRAELLRSLYGAKERSAAQKSIDAVVVEKVLRASVVAARGKGVGLSLLYNATNLAAETYRDDDGVCLAAACVIKSLNDAVGDSHAPKDAPWTCSLAAHLFGRAQRHLAAATRVGPAKGPVRDELRRVGVELERVGLDLATHVASNPVNLAALERAGLCEALVANFARPMPAPQTSSVLVEGSRVRVDTNASFSSSSPKTTWSCGVVDAVVGSNLFKTYRVRFDDGKTWEGALRDPFYEIIVEGDAALLRADQKADRKHFTDAIALATKLAERPLACAELRLARPHVAGFGTILLRATTHGASTRERVHEQCVALLAKTKPSERDAAAFRFRRPGADRARRRISTPTAATSATSSAQATLARLLRIGVLQASAPAEDTPIGDALEAVRAARPGATWQTLSLDAHLAEMSANNTQASMPPWNALADFDGAAWPEDEPRDLAKFAAAVVVADAVHTEHAARQRFFTSGSELHVLRCKLAGLNFQAGRNSSWRVIGVERLSGLREAVEQATLRVAGISVSKAQLAASRGLRTRLRLPVDDALTGVGEFAVSRLEAEVAISAALEAAHTLHLSCLRAVAGRRYALGAIHHVLGSPLPRIDWNSCVGNDDEGLNALFESSGGFDDAWRAAAATLKQRLAIALFVDEERGAGHSISKVARERHLDFFLRDSGSICSDHCIVGDVLSYYARIAACEAATFGLASADLKDVPALRSARKACEKLARRRRRRENALEGRSTSIARRWIFQPGDEAICVALSDDDGRDRRCVIVSRTGALASGEVVWRIASDGISDQSIVASLLKKDLAALNAGATIDAREKALAAAEVTLAVRTRAEQRRVLAEARAALGPCPPGTAVDWRACTFEEEDNFLASDDDLLRGLVFDDAVIQALSEQTKLSPEKVVEAEKRNIAEIARRAKSSCGEAVHANAVVSEVVAALGTNEAVLARFGDAAYIKVTSGALAGGVALDCRELKFDVPIAYLEASAAALAAAAAAARRELSARRARFQELIDDAQVAPRGEKPTMPAVLSRQALLDLREAAAFHARSRAEDVETIELYASRISDVFDEAGATPSTARLGHAVDQVEDAVRPATLERYLDRRASDLANGVLAGGDDEGDGLPFYPSVDLSRCFGGENYWLGRTRRRCRYWERRWRDVKVCSVCWDATPRAETVGGAIGGKVSVCPHFDDVCVECAKEFCKTQLGDVSRITGAGLPCVDASCAVALPLAALSATFNGRDDEGEDRLLSVRDVAKARRFIRAARMEAAKGAACWCPNTECDEVIDLTAPKPFCAVCATEVCKACQQEKHAGPCVAALDASSVKLCRDNFQKCPRCKAVVEKKMACDHMRCRCGQTFCYNCGARGHGCPMECKRPRVFDPSEAQRPVNPEPEHDSDSDDGDY